MKQASFKRSFAVMGVLGALMLGFQNCATLTAPELHDGRSRMTQIETPDEPISAPADAPTKGYDLQGKWAQACSSTGALSQRTALVFEGDRMAAKIFVFGSSDCSGQPGAQILIKGDYSVSGQSGRVSGASSLIVKTAQTATVTAMNDAFAQTFNRISYCGITTWSATVSQVLPVKSSCLNLPADSLLSGSKQVVQVADKMLFFGNFNNSRLDKSSGFSRLD